MKKITIYNQQGKKTGTIKMPEIFQFPEKPELVHRVLIWQQKNQIPSTAHTKTRGQRRGGGRKPWRQKGTGRARVGSSRSPIWRKGGIIFGPTPEINYSINLPQKIRKQAILSVLSSKASEGKVIILNKLAIGEPKTKKFEQILANLPSKGTILLISDNQFSNLSRASHNLPYLKFLNASNLNVFDLLKYQYLLLTKETLSEIEKFFIKEK